MEEQKVELQSLRQQLLVALDADNIMLSNKLCITICEALKKQANYTQAAYYALVAHKLKPSVLSEQYYEKLYQEAVLYARQQCNTNTEQKYDIQIDIVEKREQLTKLREKLANYLSTGCTSYMPAILAQFTDGMLDLIKQCSLEVETALGKPPTQYAVLLLGSYSRKEASPNSDFEFSLVVKENNEEIKQYFIHYVKLLTLQMLAYGECAQYPALWPKKLESFLPKGFAVDDGGNIPFNECGGKDELYGLPAMLANCIIVQKIPGLYYPGDTIAANALLGATFGFGDIDVAVQAQHAISQQAEKLFGVDRAVLYNRVLYKTLEKMGTTDIYSQCAMKVEVKNDEEQVYWTKEESNNLLNYLNQLWSDDSSNEAKIRFISIANNIIRSEFKACAHTQSQVFMLWLLQDNIDAFNPEKINNNKTISIKNNLTRLIVFSVACLRIYYNIQNNNSWEILAKLKEKSIISATLADILDRVLSIAFLFRARAHLFYKAENDHCILHGTNTTSNTCFTLSLNKLKEF